MCSLHAATEPHSTNSGSRTRGPHGTSIGALLLIGLIRFYRRFISPYTLPSCRFTPTCSRYGLDAVRRYGFFKGGWLATWRILRCNPFCGGGYDPLL